MWKFTRYWRSEIRELQNWKSSLFSMSYWRFIICSCTFFSLCIQYSPATFVHVFSFLRMRVKLFQFRKGTKFEMCSQFDRAVYFYMCNAIWQKNEEFPLKIVTWKRYMDSVEVWNVELFGFYYSFVFTKTNLYTSKLKIG